MIRAWAEIDTKALVHNLALAKERSKRSRPAPGVFFVFSQGESFVGIEVFSYKI